MPEARLIGALHVLTKEHVLDFCASHLWASGAQRAKLSVHVQGKDASVSTREALEEAARGSGGGGGGARLVMIEDEQRFRRAMPLFPSNL